MNPSKRAVNRGDQLTRALLIQATLPQKPTWPKRSSTYIASKYMVNRGFSLEAALFILAR